MPYIEHERRLELDKDNQLEQIGLGCQTDGELNFVITCICNGYINRVSTPSYSRFADIISTLECAKLEYYRRKVAPYEDTKKLANGDV